MLFRSVVAPNRSEMNLEDVDSVKQFASDNGSFDIVVNNAGINDVMMIDEINQESLNETMMVNLISPITLLSEIIPSMKAKRFGRIVNVGSIWGKVAKPGRTVYSATKAGIHGVTKTLASELAPWNILVNTVSPGYTMTDLTVRNNTEEQIKNIESNIPLRRLAAPEEIADVIFFVGTERNTYITGQELLVDGGYSII